MLRQLRMDSHSTGYTKGLYPGLVHHSTLQTCATCYSLRLSLGLTMFDQSCRLIQASISLGRYSKPRSFGSITPGSPPAYPNSAAYMMLFVSSPSVGNLFLASSIVTCLCLTGCPVACDHNLASSLKDSIAVYARSLFPGDDSTSALTNGPVSLRVSMNGSLTFPSHRRSNVKPSECYVV